MLCDNSRAATPVPSQLSSTADADDLLLATIEIPSTQLTPADARQEGSKAGPAHGPRARTPSPTHSEGAASTPLSPDSRLLLTRALPFRESGQSTGEREAMGILVTEGSEAFDEPYNEPYHESLDDDVCVTGGCGQGKGKAILLNDDGEGPGQEEDEDADLPQVYARPHSKAPATAATTMSTGAAAPASSNAAIVTQAEDGGDSDSDLLQPLYKPRAASAEPRPAALAAAVSSTWASSQSRTKDAGKGKAIPADNRPSGKGRTTPAATAPSDPRTTPQLAEKLKKFGVKVKGMKRAALLQKLNEIETYQKTGGAASGASSVVTTTTTTTIATSSMSAADRPPAKKSRMSSSQPLPSLSRSNSAFPSASSQPGRALDGMDVGGTSLSPLLSEEEEVDVEDEDEEDLMRFADEENWEDGGDGGDGEEEIVGDEDLFGLSQGSMGSQCDMFDSEGCVEIPRATLHEQLHSVITGDPKLHEHIVMHRTVNFASLYTTVVGKGIRCKKGELLDYLDSKGVTYTQPRKNNYRPKRAALKRIQPQGL